MLHRESPNGLAVAHMLAIHLRRRHAGHPRKVIRVDAALLQIPADPLGMITNRGGILRHRLAGDLPDRVDIHLDVTRELSGIVVADVQSEIVVDPAAMRADEMTARQQPANEALSVGIVSNVNAFAITECIYIGAGSEVDGEW